MPSADFSYPPEATGIVLRARESSASRETTPNEDYAKEDSSIPFSSFLRNYSLFPALLSFARSLPLSFLHCHFHPLDTVAVRKLK